MTSYDLIWLLILELLKNSNENNQTQNEEKCSQPISGEVSSATLFLLKKRYVPSTHIQILIDIL